MVRPTGLLAVLAALAVAAAVTATPAAAGPAAPPSCSGRAATIVATPGVPTIGTDGDDVIVGTHGPDIIRGGRGDDLICGLGGADDIAGESGDDTIRGGPGDDRVVGGTGRDRLVGNLGDDHLRGGNGGDLLRGQRGIDSCDGGPGVDVKRACERAAALATKRILAIGDSVMLAASRRYCNELRRAVPGIHENAEKGRKFDTGLGIVKQEALVDEPTIYVVGLGTNGPFTPESLDEMFAADPDALFAHVNIHAPRSFEDDVNRVIEDGVERHARRAILIDWYSLAAADDALTVEDGIHLTCTGAEVYARAVAEGLSALD